MWQHKMKKKHQRTLKIIYKCPIQSSLIWSDIEKLLVDLGAKTKDVNWSRFAAELNNIRAYFQRPDQKNLIDKSVLVSTRKFLENAGVK